MKIDKTRLLEIVRHTLSPEQLKKSLIFWDKRIHEEGETIRIGLQSVPMPFRGIMIFVDLAPDYNWAHPCLYLFFDCKAEKTQTIRASFPPAIPLDNENYVILLRFGDIPPDERYFFAFDRNEPKKKGEQDETE
jgi:hypothetical protein